MYTKSDSVVCYIGIKGVVATLRSRVCSVTLDNECGVLH